MFNKDNTIFYQCRVLNNNDPMMLGRIRGIRLIDNYDDILKSISDPPWNEEKDIWTSRDPFVFNTLLPYFVYAIPKENELVQVIYVNKDFRYQNQYYVQNTFSTPTATFQEFYYGGNKFTGMGMQIKNPKPLKNQDGTFTDQSIHKGVFPQPGDNAILGRGSADLIVKQDEVLLRAGKFKGNQLQPNVIPVANQQRGFLQLSRFDTSITNLQPKVYFELEEVAVLTKYLIEWVVTNPENTQDKFSGNVYLYQLQPDQSINSKNISVNSEIPENLKRIVAVESFSLLTKAEVIKFINDFIQTCNETNVTKNGLRLFEDNQASEKFPIFYRPNGLMYSKLNPSAPPVPTYNEKYSSVGNKFCIVGSCNIDIRVIDRSTGSIVAASGGNGPESETDQTYKSVVNDVTSKLAELQIEGVIMPTVSQLDGSTIEPPTETNSSESAIVSANVSDIYKGIKLNPALTGGYGLIYAKDKVGIPRNPVKKVIQQKKYTYQESSYGALGSDTLFLLSHNSQIPNKGKINFDDTLYGISVEKFTNELLPKTSSMVRGEELLELINLIVRFLVTHTHAYPGLAPVPVTEDGSNSQSIITEMQNAVNKILNKNIRLN